MPDDTRHQELTQEFATPLYAQAVEVDWTRDVDTNTGFAIHIRPARPGDEDALADLFAKLSPDDLRHRFLTAVRNVSKDVLEAMVRNDNPHGISFLAFERFTGELIAAAQLVAESDYSSAEFAVATRPDRKAHGVSWALLDHLVRYAEAAGIGRVTSLETSDDDKALKLEREMGFTVRACPDDATLMIAEKQLR